MPFLAIRTPLKIAACTAVALLMVSCSSSRTSAPQTAGTISAKPGLDINRAHKDGAPWWDVDVSRIPDATPTLHTGPYKANPYTVLGKTYFPIQESKNYVASGTASWYGTKFHGQNTANGEVYDLYGMSAAHKTLPPPQQHASDVIPPPVAHKGQGTYLQVGAFANPDAAELLRSKLSGMVSAPVFISSIVRNQQTLHRVRMGPIASAGEVQQTQNSVRLANLGQPSVVTDQ